MELIPQVYYKGRHNKLKRKLLHLAPHWQQSSLFPGNFVQLASEPIENGDLSEIETSLIKESL